MQEIALKEEEKRILPIVDIAERVKALAVHSHETAELAGAAVEWSHGQIKALTEARDEMLAPVRETERRIRAFFAAPLAALEAAKAHAKGSLAGYLQAAARANAEAMTRAAEAAREGRADEAREEAQALIPIVVPASVTIVERWVFRVIAPEMVPRDFLTVDERKIRAYLAKTGKGEVPTPVPGVAFSLETSARAK